MKELTTSSRTRIVIAAAMMASPLAVGGAAATDVIALGGSATAPWTHHIRQVDEALARKHVSAAERAWHAAYLAALKSRRWEAMMEVGNTYLRIGEVTRGRKTAQATARRLYLAALFRARHQRSLDGVLRATEAFAALGDHEVAEQGVYIAYNLAAQVQDPEARARVNAIARRLAARFSGPGSSEFD